MIIGDRKYDEAGMWRRIPQEPGLNTTVVAWELLEPSRAHKERREQDRIARRIEREVAREQRLDAEAEQLANRVEAKLVERARARQQAQTAQKTDGA